MTLARLRRFVIDVASLLRDDPPEAAILEGGQDLLGALVAHDDWLPDAFAAPATPYGQYLLHCDSAERFSIVSFVWSPGQSTPVHNHTVWGLVGVLRGLEISQPFAFTPAGLEAGVPRELRPGAVESLSPRTGDIHRVSNGLADQASVSIHVYGGNIGCVERSAFDQTGVARRFMSGYTGVVIPNLWSPAGA
jgi:predicted metal-dependent enzyme (double-stranded beta helix superfamily)